MKAQSAVLFTESKSFLPTSASHIENNYVDFDMDLLMPHMLSNLSPKIVKGDVNNDGADDFFLLQSHGYSNKLFINSKSGFKESIQNSFKQNREKESTAGALFDADGDKDLDLIVGMGGNEFKRGGDNFFAEFYKWSFYLNGTSKITIKNLLNINI